MSGERRRLSQTWERRAGEREPSRGERDVEQRREGATQDGPERTETALAVPFFSLRCAGVDG